MHIFISYAKQDTRNLALSLDAEFNELLGVTSWVDKKLKPGRGWTRQIEHQIKLCDLMIVLISPDVNREPNNERDYSFVINEIAFAKKYRKEILPVVAQPADIPIEIINLEYIDLTLNLAEGKTRLFNFVREVAGTDVLEAELSAQQAPELDFIEEPAETETPPIENHAAVSDDEKRPVSFTLEEVFPLETETTDEDFSKDVDPPPPTDQVYSEPMPDPIEDKLIFSKKLPRRMMRFRWIFIGLGGLLICLLLAGGISWNLYKNFASVTLRLNGKDGFVNLDGDVYYANADWEVEAKTFDEVDMVLVPRGCFHMGGDGKTKICYDDPFWIDKYEVTEAQFVSFGGDLYEDLEPDETEEYTPSDELPVHDISWSAAKAVCAERGGRLPTEAEWEYAARGPDGNIYPWGDEFFRTYVNCSSLGCSSDSYRTRAPVGSFPEGASWVGALDMVGNVDEWTSTIWADYPYDATDGREDQDNQTALRVSRGGSYRSKWSGVQASARVGQIYTGSSGLGFRCVLDY